MLVTSSVECECKFDFKPGQLLKSSQVGAGQLGLAVFHCTTATGLPVRASVSQPPRQITAPGFTEQIAASVGLGFVLLNLNPRMVRYIFFLKLLGGEGSCYIIRRAYHPVKATEGPTSKFRLVNSARVFGKREIQPLVHDLVRVDLVLLQF
jgi:hypothetical protein